MPTVRVQEFARELDGGGTIPGDGTKVSLGLGRPTRATSQSLGGPYGSTDARAIEERTWVPSEQRMRMLRSAMGDAGFGRALLQHLEEYDSIQRSRAQCEEDGEDQLPMPTSMREAHARAADLSKEMRHSRGQAAAAASSSESTAAVAAALAATPPPPSLEEKAHPASGGCADHAAAGVRYISFPGPGASMPGASVSAAMRRKSPRSRSRGRRVVSGHLPAASGDQAASHALGTPR